MMKKFFLTLCYDGTHLLLGRGIHGQSDRSGYVPDLCLSPVLEAVTAEGINAKGKMDHGSVTFTDFCCQPETNFLKHSLLGWRDGSVANLENSGSIPSTHKAVHKPL